MLSIYFNIKTSGIYNVEKQLAIILKVHPHNLMSIYVHGAVTMSSVLYCERMELQQLANSFTHTLLMAAK